jgi:hypothetical protein
VAAGIAGAVSLLQQGRAAEAEEHLLQIETAHPGLYETAANLGMACELAGKLEEAMIWIARGIERSGNGWRGIDWLHAAIVRTKLKLRADANWLTEHTVLEGVAERSRDEILRAIEPQLEQRVKYVKPSDAILCDLFFQAGLRVSGDNALSRRAYYFRESLRFGDWRKAEIAALART